MKGDKKIESFKEDLNISRTEHTGFQRSPLSEAYYFIDSFSDVRKTRETGLEAVQRAIEKFGEELIECLTGGI